MLYLNCPTLGRPHPKVHSFIIYRVSHISVTWFLGMGTNQLFLFFPLPVATTARRRLKILMFFVDSESPQLPGLAFSHCLWCFAVVFFAKVTALPECLKNWETSASTNAAVLQTACANQVGAMDRSLNRQALFDYIVVFVLIYCNFVRRHYHGHSPSVGLAGVTNTIDQRIIYAEHDWITRLFLIQYMKTLFLKLLALIGLELWIEGPRSKGSRQAR